MNCPQAAVISDLVDGRLSPVEISDVERHLDGCSRCADLVAVAVSSRGATTAATAVPGGGAPTGRLGDAVIPAGTRLERYEVRRWIGRGGMGDVYEGFDPKLERGVAIKLLRGRDSDRQSAQRRLEREAKTLARLSSANVVVALDIGVYADRMFLVMELVEGPTLAGWLRAAPRGWRQILDAFLEAGDGLAAAHEVGVVHRDFKPQNVLIGSDGKARVSDFGLARASETKSGDSETRAHAGAAGGGDGQTLTEAGPVGTPRYMAPEQFLNQPADARADQFSFCVALYEALYGRHPFADDRTVPTDDCVDTLREAVLAGRPAAPSGKTGAPGVPGPIAAVLLRGLARKPEARFPTMRDLLVAIRAAAGVRRRRGLKVTIAISAAVVVLAAATAAWVALSETGRVVLEPVGEPADWTKARIIFRVPERIHCVMPISTKVVRVVWGRPRRVEDVDVTTGARRSTDLLPATYRYGCPELSPDARQLIYEGYDSKNRPHIFHSLNPSGRDAEPIVSCVEPTDDSQPLWLSSSRHFVFDVGFQHPAVFSLDTSNFTILSDAARFGNSPSGFYKSVSQAGDRIAVAQGHDERWGGFVSVYQWPSLKLVTRFRYAPPTWLNWRFGLDPRFLYGRIAGEVDFIAEFSSEKERLSSWVRVSRRDVAEYRQLDQTTGMIVTKWIKSDVRYTDAQGIEHQVPREELAYYKSATEMETGDLLLARIAHDRTNIVRFRPSDGSLQDLTEGGKILP